jgi:hypothetical protein
MLFKNSSINVATIPLGRNAMIHENDRLTGGKGAEEGEAPPHRQNPFPHVLTGPPWGSAHNGLHPVDSRFLSRSHTQMWIFAWAYRGGRSPSPDAGKRRNGKRWNSIQAFYSSSPFTHLPIYPFPLFAPFCMTRRCLLLTRRAGYAGLRKIIIAPRVCRSSSSNA